MATPLAELQPLIEALKSAPPQTFTDPVDQLRLQADLGVIGMAPFVRAVTLAEVSDHTIPVAGGEIPVRVYRPQAGSSRSVHIHLHGGGWWMGSIETVDAMSRDLADRAGLTVVSVGYRLAPENPWPAAPEDAYAALCWLVAHAEELQIDPASISLGGESAGANIAAAVALMTRDRRGPGLVALWLDVPVVDLRLPETASQVEFGSGFGLEVTHAQTIADWYAAPADRDHPYASPGNADLTGLPFTIITTAELDPMRDQGQSFARALRDAGVPVDLRQAAGHLHGTSWLTGLIPSAAQWHDDIVGVLVAQHRAAARHGASE